MKIKLDVFLIGGATCYGFIVHGISDGVYYYNLTSGANTEISSVPLTFKSRMDFSIAQDNGSPLTCIYTNREESCWTYYELFGGHTASFLKMYGYSIDYTSTVSPSALTINQGVMLDPSTEAIREFAKDKGFDLFEPCCYDSGGDVS